MSRWIGTMVVVALVAGGVSAGMLMLMPSAIPAISPLGAASDVPSQINHQGVVSVSGIRFTGTGYFRFAIVDPGPSEAIVWSNDGNSPPTTDVALTVTDGVYSVALGDAGMTAIPSSLFADGDLKLRVWFDDNVNGIQQLTPDHPLNTSPYAFTVADNAISTAKIADGAVTGAKLSSAVNVVPQGAIMMWSGSVGSIPSGWQLCDGTNGTPDLRDKFLVGAGGTYAVGNTGGAASHSHATSATASTAGAHTHSTDIGSFSTTGGEGAHSHSVDIASFTSGAESGHTHSVDVANTTTSSDAHTHAGGSLRFSREINPTGSCGGSGGYYIYVVSGGTDQCMYVDWAGATSSDSHSHTVNPAAVTSGAGSSHTHAINPGATASSSTGGHNHTFDLPATNSSSNGDHAHTLNFTNPTSDSRPPYYALCYIMKL